VFLKSIMGLADYDDEERNATKLVGYQWIKRTTDKLHVELDFLAIRFAKYYWDMYYRFRLRQSHNPSDVNIHKFFKDTDKNLLRPPTLEDLANQKHQELRRNVIKRSIKPEVLGRLNKDLGLYEIVKGKDHIIFEHGIVEFFQKFKGILNPAINYVLTRYLERINFSPRIAEKVRGIPTRDHLTTREKEKLLKFHGDACFYCDKPVERYHIDHVIPFDYLFSTELFNSVLACARCNSRKLNRLPSEAIFDKVLDRNKKLTMPKGYDQGWYQNLYRKCIVEYHGKREYFKPH
jgi:5-methylcytosine-specific restriction endonuclease McrA